MHRKEHLDGWIFILANVSATYAGHALDAVAASALVFAWASRCFC
jgi:hypothetical protein